MDDALHHLREIGAGAAPFVSPRQRTPLASPVDHDGTPVRPFPDPVVDVVTGERRETEREKGRKDRREEAWRHGRSYLAMSETLTL